MSKETLFPGNTMINIKSEYLAIKNKTRIHLKKIKMRFS
jgi:hypothetical protein